MSNSVVGKWNGYDIQIIDIQPNDTILLHLDDDLDFEAVSAILKEMQKVFPKNTIIPVNEWVLKGMTIVRQHACTIINDKVDAWHINQPLEELYPEIFGEVI